MLDVNVDKAATAAVDEAAKTIMPQLGAQLAQAVDEAALTIKPQLDTAITRLESLAKALPTDLASAVSPLLAEALVGLGNELKELLIGRTITITIG